MMYLKVMLMIVMGICAQDYAIIDLYGISPPSPRYVNMEIFNDDLSNFLPPNSPINVTIPSSCPITFSDNSTRMYTNTDNIYNIYMNLLLSGNFSNGEICGPLVIEGGRTLPNQTFIRMNEYVPVGLSIYGSLYLYNDSIVRHLTYMLTANGDYGMRPHDQYESLTIEGCPATFSDGTTHTTLFSNSGFFYIDMMLSEDAVFVDGQRCTINSTSFSDTRSVTPTIFLFHTS